MCNGHLTLAATQYAATLSMCNGHLTLAARQYAATIDNVLLSDGLHDFNSIKLLAALKRMRNIIHVTWLGFAGPVGQGHRHRHGFSYQSRQSLIDYMLVDSIILPPDGIHTRYYSENLAYLPHGYQPQDNKVNSKHSEIMFASINSTSHNYLYHLRSQLQHCRDDNHSQLCNDLKRHVQEIKSTERRRLLALIFSDSSYCDAIESNLSTCHSFRRFEESVHKNWLISFNRQAKITLDVYEDWMMILRQVPSSLLILMAENEEGKRSLLVCCSIVY
jgi:hypothetical protein